MANPFGHSLLFYDDRATGRFDDPRFYGDLVFENERLVEIEGRDNLAQALILRILTPLGTDSFDTRYGLDAEGIFNHAGNERMTRELIKLNLVRTLSTDPRVREVLDVVFPEDPEFVVANRLDAEAAEQRRRSRVWRVEVTVATVDGSTQILTLGVGV